MSEKIIIPAKPDLNKLTLESKLETFCKACQEQSTCRIPDEMVCSLCAYDSLENYKKFKEQEKMKQIIIMPDPKLNIIEECMDFETSDICLFMDCRFKVDCDDCALLSLENFAKYKAQQEKK